MSNTPLVNFDFENLAESPPTQKVMQAWKASLLKPHNASRRNAKLITTTTAAVTLGIMTYLSLSLNAQIALIDYLLIACITFSLGFLIWGWLDDRALRNHPEYVRINGVSYHRRAYESLRDATSFWDPCGIEDISIPENAIQVHRYIDNVVHGLGRRLVRFDRELIVQVLQTHQQ